MIFDLYIGRTGLTVTGVKFYDGNTQRGTSGGYSATETSPMRYRIDVTDTLDAFAGATLRVVAPHQSIVGWVLAADGETVRGSIAEQAAAAALTALAAKFAGITLLSEWLGIMAGKQVGDTTARTELRDTGAGAGTYDETTDSLEAAADAAASIAAILSAEAVARVPVISHSLLSLIEGMTYDGTLGTTKVGWTTTADYTTADSIALTIWRINEDNTRTIMLTQSLEAVSDTLVEAESMTATFTQAINYSGCPAHEKLQFATIAEKDGNLYPIALGDCYVREAQ